MAKPTWCASCPRTLPGAKDAKLATYQKCGEAGELTLVRVRLFTGRSHQIRVQLAHAGLPIWGDARYGGGRPGEQIALWGAHLGLIHPTKKEEMHFGRAPADGRAAVANGLTRGFGQKKVKSACEREEKAEPGFVYMMEVRLRGV